MTAPLEVLRDAIDRCARGRQSHVTLSLDDAVPILTAIGERDAEIERLRREVRRMASRLQRTHRNAGRFADDAAKATSRFKAAVKRALQDADQIATLTRQLAEAREFGEKAAKLYNDTLVLRCAFCGEAYEDGTPPSRHERLTEHVKVCPAHPMRDVERQLADAKAHRDEFDRLASVQRERANGLEYQCGIYEAKLARYEQAEKEIWERTPGWLGEQLPALAAYLAGVEQQRDAMREALREIAERGCSLFLNAVPRRKTPPYCCDDDDLCDGCRARRALGAL